MPDGAYGHDPRTPGFEITHPTEPTEVMLAGFSSFGLAGLTAVDYLVDHLELEEVGHVSVEALPAITPFEAGTPRHHTRLFSRDGLDVTVLVNELFIPTFAADAFGNAIREWADGSGVGEVAVVSGVPVPHGPEEHRVFYVATEDYRERRLAETDVPAMGSGFLDGVNAELMGHGLDSDLAVGVYTTPVHPQTPDVEAAVRLLDAVGSVYDLEVDTAPLEEFAAEVQQYYADLAERVEAASESQQPEDRMYM